VTMETGIKTRTGETERVGKRTKKGEKHLIHIAGKEKKKEKKRATEEVHWGENSQASTK